MGTGTFASHVTVEKQRRSWRLALCSAPVSGDALLLMAELLKVFVVEAAIRSVRQAQAEDLACVDVDQLEKVLPQLTARRLRVPAACSAGDRAQRCGRRACDLWRQAELRKPPPTSKLVCHLQTRCCSLS
ncbi:centromere protein X isoform X3 [Sturnira hondurensis]|uniref:centromere protein X isoform X3 n=1 Tax=Sturnira hondurensis TaxID=192404 RepID=UPI00187AB94B|nr:centromere protein X isoform X3 [Sturnira hondurensis]